jgi:hypothetical protein
METVELVYDALVFGYSYCDADGDSEPDGLFRHLLGAVLEILGIEPPLDMQNRPQLSAVANRVVLLEMRTRSDAFDRADPELVRRARQAAERLRAAMLPRVEKEAENAYRDQASASTNYSQSSAADRAVAYAPPDPEGPLCPVCHAVTDRKDFCMECGAFLDLGYGENGPQIVEDAAPSDSAPHRPPSPASRPASPPVPGRSHIQPAGRREELSLEERLERAIRKDVRPGQLAFEAPRQMGLYEGRSVRVALSRSVELDELRKVLPAMRTESPLQLEQTSPLMEVVLSGDAFDIEARSKPEQYVSAEKATVWEFAVTAKQRGRHELVLVVNMRLPVRGFPDLYASAPSITRSISVLQANGVAAAGNAIHAGIAAADAIAACRAGAVWNGEHSQELATWKLLGEQTAAKLQPSYVDFLHLKRVLNMTVPP